MVQGWKQESIIEYLHFQRNQAIRVERQLNNEIDQLYKRCPGVVCGKKTLFFEKLWENEKYVLIHIQNR